MQFLYVCSRPIIGIDGKLHRHLLGILLHKNNEYQFRYALGGDDDKNNTLLLSIFPDKHKIYDDHDTRLLLDDYLPSENNTTYIKNILQKLGMTEYNEWEWLKAFESTDENAETKLYEALPEDVIVHENIGNVLNNIKNCADIDEIANEESDFETAEDFEDNDIMSIDDLFPIEKQDSDFPFDDDINIAYVLDDIFENQKSAQEQIVEKEIKAEPESSQTMVEPLKSNTVKIITRQVVRHGQHKQKINNSPLLDTNIATILQQRLQKNIEQRKKSLEKAKEKININIDNQSC